MKKFVIILFIYPCFLFSQNDSLTKQFIKDFVKEKFPMLGGAVDNMFADAGGSDEPGM